MLGRFLNSCQYFVQSRCDMQCFFWYVDIIEMGTLEKNCAILIDIKATRTQSLDQQLTLET